MFLLSDIRMMSPRAFDHAQTDENAIASRESRFPLRESSSLYGKNLCGHRSCPAASYETVFPSLSRRGNGYNATCFLRSESLSTLITSRAIKRFVPNIVSPSSNSSPGHKVRLTHSSINIPISINFVGHGLERLAHFDWHPARTSPNRFR